MTKSPMDQHLDAVFEASAGMRIISETLYQGPVDDRRASDMACVLRGLHLRLEPVIELMMQLQVKGPLISIDDLRQSIKAEKQRRKLDQDEKEARP